MASPVAANTVVRGYTGTHIFNTAGSGGEPGEQPVCGVVGGASQWITFVPLDTGLLHLNTAGSSYNTVMAVFRRSLANPAVLQLIDCDNNSGQDGRDSALSLPVDSGVTNFVMVDGVNGATGTLHLNYSLITTTLLTPLAPNGLGQPRFRLTGHPAMNFRIETSLDMAIWSTLFTTNSADAIFEFTDTNPNPQRRFYRAVMLP